MEKELPKGWVITKLGVIAEWGSGGTPNRSEPKYYDGTIPWVKTGDLNDSIILKASEYITDLGLKKSSAKLFPKGSIIVAMYGATIGKTAKLGIDATTNQACAVAIASKIVVPEFLHYFLKSEKQEFIDKGKGGAQPNISQTVIKEHPFPLPPLPEQQRIVAKLDTLFGHLDALKNRLERIPQLIKEFRQKVLTQAVTGKLTEEWREGRELDSGKFLKLVQWKQAKKIHPCKVRGQKGFSQKNKFYEIPQSWNWIPINELVKDGSNSVCAGPFGTIFKAKDFRESGIPIIFLRHVKPEGFNQRKPNFMDEEVWKKYHQEYSVFGGELLVTKLGDPPGDAIIYPFNIGTAMVTPDVMKADFDNEIVITEYLQHFINSEKCKEILSDVSFGMTRLRIDLTMFKSLPIPTPTFEEQQEIVHRVEALFAKADQIEAGYQKLKAKVDQLPQALLAKAFRGELVPQLPTDGDARELLEEIKRAKEGLEKGGKGKKMKVEDELRMVAEDGARYGKK